MKIFFALFFAVFTVAAQTPEVPHKMQFAGMTLSIRDDARREIQKDVNALTQSPRHHNIKVERAKTYFPIIEKVFQEENVPDDFKYLVLQESALIADAVSVSNAVGFWQFKEYTALEMGLRVDKEIDERMNIVASSRAAAKYIKKNNFYFNNWIYALQAYQMGAGGVLKSEKEAKSGQKHVEITSGTYWYIKKYLAHKIAFEGAVNGPGQIQVLPYETKSKKQLNEIALEVAVTDTELAAYNKWARKGTIPDDRTYTVLIPVVGQATPVKLPSSTSGVVATATSSPSAAGKSSVNASTPKGSKMIKVNGIPALQANPGETPTQLASRAGVDLSDFLKWNDISISDRMDAEMYYLLGKKRTRAGESYHKVSKGDNLWRISQHYGVQVKKLKKYNRITSDRELAPGMTLWLTATKPRDAEGTATPAEVVQVDNSDTFAWTADPGQSQPTVSLKPVAVAPVITEGSTANTNESKAADTISVQNSPAPTSEISNVEVTPSITVVSLGTADTVTVVKEKQTQHTVQAGETLYAIASLYEVGVMDLVNWNSLSLQESIKPGQVIQLTEPQPAPSEEAVSAPPPIELEHIVKPTDTLYSIARKYDVTIQNLMSWNDKKDFTLAVGEKLKVKRK
jgi:membrane-bound lytic murein transglycosylase D